MPDDGEIAGFSDLADIAATLCDESVATISLVQETTQRQIAVAGMLPTEMACEDLPCSSVVTSGKPVVIGDLSVDPRTRDSVLVTSAPYFRFYVGVPLRMPSGHVIGTLCVMGARARPEGVPPAKIRALEALARQAAFTLHDHRMKRLQANRVVLGGANENALAASALRVEHDAIQSVGEIGGIGTFEMELSSNIASVSPEVCRIFGLPLARAYPLERLIACMVIRDEGLLRLTETYGQDIPSLEAEYAIRRANDGAERWLRRRAGVESRVEGGTLRLFGTIEDVTRDRVVNNRLSALVTLGDDLRAADSALEAYSVAARVLGEALGVDRAGYADITSGAHGHIAVRYDWTPDGRSSLVGMVDRKEFADSLQFLERGLLLAISDTDEVTWLEREVELYHRIAVRSQLVIPLLSQGALSGCIFLQSAVPRDWGDQEIAFLRAVTDRAQAAAASLDARRRQQTMHEELAHRLKNTLALVQALANQSLRGIGDRAAVRAFERRLVALGSAHDLLMRQAWRSGKLVELARDVLGRIAPIERFHMEGPEVSLGPNTSTSFCLMLHELGTNAAKYGALSTEKGSVFLTWHIAALPTGHELCVTWEERGGPTITAPVHRGFGSRLLKGGFGKQGVAEIVYPPEGCRARFTVQLALATEN